MAKGINFKEAEGHGICRSRFSCATVKKKFVLAGGGTIKVLSYVRCT